MPPRQPAEGCRGSSPTPETTSQEKALDAFLAKKAQIDDRLALAEGHVGDLGRYAELLERITDMAFREGEHAA